MGACVNPELLAAAAQYALNHHVDRLADDHRRALTLAHGALELGLELTLPETNIVYINVADSATFVQGLSDHGISCLAVSPTRVRLVVHLGINDAAVDATLNGMRAVVFVARSLLGAGVQYAVLNRDF